MPEDRPTSRGPVVLLLLVLLVVSLLVGLVVASAVQVLLPDAWPFGVRFWLPAAGLALVLFAAQAWAWWAIRHPPRDY